MIAKDGRSWHEVVTEDVLKQSPLFKDGDAVLLEQVVLALSPVQAEQGEELIRRGDLGREMFLIEQGEVEVIGADGKVIRTLKDGDVFGEVGVLTSKPRNATVRATMPTDLYRLDKKDFSRILRDNPNFANAIQQIAKERFNLVVDSNSLLAPS
jgi:CRP-like cAMP-binding protein